MKTFRTALGMILTAALLAGCGTTANVGGSDQKDLLASRSKAALADFHALDPSLKSVIDSSYAYAIFPRVVTAAVGVGGAHGDGEVYQKGKLIGYADVSQGSVGFQLGAQRYAQLVVFRSEAPFLNFTNGALEFDARASAVAAANGAAAAADYSSGVLVFTMSEAGLMFQAAIGGQKFRYTPLKD